MSRAGADLGLAFAIARAWAELRGRRVPVAEPPRGRSPLGFALLGSCGSAVVLLAVAPTAARGIAAAPSASDTPTERPPALDLPAPALPDWIADRRVGTVDAPVQIPGLPYHADGDTRGVSSAMARYACAPTVGEGGGEVWYAVAVRGEGRLRASITEDPADGVDVDVHLLSHPDPDGCVARGDAAAEAQVGPGAWFVVVDTCSTSGRPLPGPFALDVTFARSPARAPR